jgi:hypothetical protein
MVGVAWILNAVWGARKRKRSSQTTNTSDPPQKNCVSRSACTPTRCWNKASLLNGVLESTLCYLQLIHLAVESTSP